MRQQLLSHVNLKQLQSCLLTYNEDYFSILVVHISTDYCKPQIKSMEQSPTGEAISRSAGQEISSPLTEASLPSSQEHTSGQRIHPGPRPCGLLHPDLTP